jgi:hypothetical protein
MALLPPPLSSFATCALRLATDDKIFHFLARFGKMAFIVSKLNFLGCNPGSHLPYILDGASAWAVTWAALFFA